MDLAPYKTLPPRAYTICQPICEDLEDPLGDRQHLIQSIFAHPGDVLLNGKSQSLRGVIEALNMVLGKPEKLCEGLDHLHHTIPILHRKQK